MVHIKIMPNNKIIVDGESYDDRLFSDYTMAQIKAVKALRKALEKFPGLYNDNMNNKKFKTLKK